jgi:Protein of unknown function (DUF3606)
MSGKRSNRRRRNRSRVASGQAYEVTYFARKHGITRAQAERIIGRARGNRQLANALCFLIRKEFLAA